MISPEAGTRIIGTHDGFKFEIELFGIKEEKRKAPGKSRQPAGISLITA